MGIQALLLEFQTGRYASQQPEVRESKSSIFTLWSQVSHPHKYGQLIKFCAYDCGSQRILHRGAEFGQIAVREVTKLGERRLGLTLVAIDGLVLIVVICFFDLTSPALKRNNVP